MTPRDRDEDTAWFGAALGTAVAAMGMCALFFAEAYLRARADRWPPAGVPRVPRILPTLNGVVLGGAVAAFHRAGGSRSGDRSHRSSGTERSYVLKRNLIWVLALGGLALGLDAVLWRTLFARGFTLTQTGVYGALFFGISFVHAALVALGLCGVASLLRRPRVSAARGWRLFWDFLAAAWAVFVVGGIWL